MISTSALLVTFLTPGLVSAPSTALATSSAWAQTAIMAAGTLEEASRISPTVVNFDQQALDSLNTIYRGIDYLYQQMKNLPESQRNFGHFAATYNDLETAIVSLAHRQNLRPVDGSSQQTAKNIQTLHSLWQQDVQMHKKTNTLTDFTIKRRISQYRRLLDAMISGELAKQ